MCSTVVFSTSALLSLSRLLLPTYCNRLRQTQTHWSLAELGRIALRATLVLELCMPIWLEPAKAILISLLLDPNFRHAPNSVEHVFRFDSHLS